MSTKHLHTGSPSQATTSCFGGRQSRRLRGRGLRAGLAAALVATGAIVIAPAAGAKESDNQESSSEVRSNDRESQNDESNAQSANEEGRRHRRPKLTDEQRACLEEQGIDLPERKDKADSEQQDDSNARNAQEGEDGNNEQRAREDRPRPTEEQKEQFRAAAEACGIELPERPADDGSQNEQPERPQDEEQDEAPTDDA